jgi:hypothetical protein
MSERDQCLRPHRLVRTRRGSTGRLPRPGGRPLHQEQHLQQLRLSHDAGARCVGRSPGGARLDAGGGAGGPCSCLAAALQFRCWSCPRQACRWRGAGSSCRRVPVWVPVPSLRGGVPLHLQACALQLASSWGSVGAAATPTASLTATARARTGGGAGASAPPRRPWALPAKRLWTATQVCVQGGRRRGTAGGEGCLPMAGDARDPTRARASAMLPAAGRSWAAQLMRQAPCPPPAAGSCSGSGKCACLLDAHCGAGSICAEPGSPAGCRALRLFGAPCSLGRQCVSNLCIAGKVRGSC